MPLHEPTTSKSSTTVGVEKTQPPVSNSQMGCGSAGAEDWIEFWAVARTAMRRRYRQFSKSAISFVPPHEATACALRERTFEVDLQNYRRTVQVLRSLANSL